MTNWKQFLTEKVLGECWHNVQQGACGVFSCVNCGYIPNEIQDNYNRSFDNRDDLLDLYEAIYKEGKWKDYVNYSNSKWWKNVAAAYILVEKVIADYNAWLFCLDKKGYKEHAKMIAEFYGWEEGK